MEIKEKVKEIFMEVFPGNHRIDENTGPGDIDGWDSLNHIVLIDKIESIFAIKFELEEVLEMQNFGAICEAVEKKLAS